MIIPATYNENRRRISIGAGEDQQMARIWTKPPDDKSTINPAGKVLVQSLDFDWMLQNWDKYSDSIDVINQWRAAHAYPLHIFQNNLRKTAARFDETAVIAQRIKRLHSIGLKLSRFPSMKLSQMQDLGGCRAIVKTSRNVEVLLKYYQLHSRMTHECATVDNYIDSPKESGYRGVHLVYRYRNDNAEKSIYEGCKIEMQLRSRYQHAWATAVETVGMFSGQALKSSLGSDDWKRFFALMGSAIAIRERRPTVPGTPKLRRDLIGELQELSDSLNVETRLREYGQAFRKISRSAESGSYFLLELIPDRQELVVNGYKQAELAKAEEAYAIAEKDKSRDAVLVSVSSINQLSRAYPNYFADTRFFLLLMRQVLSGHSRGIVVPQLTLDFTEE